MNTVSSYEATTQSTQLSCSLRCKWREHLLELWKLEWKKNRQCITCHHGFHVHIAIQLASYHYWDEFHGTSLLMCVCVCVCVCTCARRVMCVHLFVTPGPSSPGSSVQGIFLARILEWVAISFSKGSSRLRDQTHISCISCIGRQILYHWATGEVLLYWGELKFKNLFIQNISMYLLCSKHRSTDQRYRDE